MTISDYFMILAVMIAPFLAVFVQKQIETWKSKRDVKLSIFKTLMATRGATLSQQHVQALNMIDLEFSDKNKKEREVIRIWKEYLDHLASLPKDPDENKAALPNWVDKNTDYLADLLQAMGLCLGYDFDKVHIKRGIYSPEGHTQAELEQRAIRFYALQVLSGKQSISTLTSLIPSNANDEEFGRKIQKVLSEYLDGKRDFSITIKREKSKMAEKPER